jgi:hypothetical protein
MAGSTGAEMAQLMCIVLVGRATLFLAGGIAVIFWGALQVVVDTTPGGGHTVSFSGTLVPFFDGPFSPYQANFSAAISTGVQWISLR